MVPRTSMALKLGISTDRLISYEFGRVKLPWEVGHALCRTWNINPVWLATGEGERTGGVIALDERLVAAIGPKPLFAEVVDNILVPLEKGPEFLPAHLRSALDSINAGTETAKGDTAATAQPTRGNALTIDQAAAWNGLAFGLLRSAFASVDTSQLPSFCLDLSSAIIDVTKQYSKEKK